MQASSDSSSHTTAKEPAQRVASGAAADPNGEIDLQAILAEVEALANLAGAPIERSSAPSEAAAPLAGAPAAPAPAPSIDFAALERDIASLLSGEAPVKDSSDAARSGPTPTNGTLSGGTDAAEDPGVGPEVNREVGVGVGVGSMEPPGEEPAASVPASLPDVVAQSLAAPASDPMLREIHDLLDDTNDAVLKRSNDLDSALESVFDPQALAGQEEDVNRALIEAFGTSRRDSGSFGSANITHPAPKFEGISRTIPPELHASPAAEAQPSATGAAPTRSFEDIASESIAKERRAEYAGETPFEPAFPAIPAMPNSAAPASPVLAAESAGPATTPSGPRQATASVRSGAPDDLHDGEAHGGTPAPEARSRAMSSWLRTGLQRIGAVVAAIASAPFRVLALPMKLLPPQGRSIVSAAAISMVVCVPLAWWLAHRSTNAPGIGRVAFPTTSSAEAAGSHGSNAGNGETGEGSSREGGSDAASTGASSASSASHASGRTGDASHH